MTSDETLRELLVIQVPGLSDCARVDRDAPPAHTTVVAVPDDAAAISAVASSAGDSNSAPDLIELYGGLTAATAAEIGHIAPRAAVGTGSQLCGTGPAAVIVESTRADPAHDRYTFGTANEPTTVVFVPSPDVAPVVAKELTDSGARFVQLCGGLGYSAVAAVQDEIGGAAHAEAVLFGFEALPAAARYRARFESAWSRHLTRSSS